MNNTLRNNFIPIVSYDEPSGFPLLSASSGFLIFINGDIYLFGAFHSLVDNLTNISNLNQKYKFIAAELFYEAHKGATIIPFALKHLNFSTTISLKSPTKSFIPDFFFVKIPEKKDIYKLNTAKIVLNNNVIGTNKTHIFNKIVDISINDRYAFAGNIKTKIISIDTYPYNAKISEIICYTDLEYIESYNLNHTYIFKLNESNKKISDFKGCSGAPIVNSNNELISIAIKVICKENEVKVIGINLKHYESLIGLIISLPNLEMECNIRNKAL